MDRIYQERKIYVKRKKWMLPYERDPCGMALGTRAFLQLSVTHEDCHNCVSMCAVCRDDGPEHYSELMELFKEHDIDPVFTGFAKTYCSEGHSLAAPRPGQLTNAWCVVARMQDPRMRDFVLFCRGILSECVEQDKPDMLNTYMDVHRLYDKCKQLASEAEPIRSVSAGQPRRTRSEIGKWPLNAVSSE